MKKVMNTKIHLLTPVGKVIVPVEISYDDMFQKITAHFVCRSAVDFGIV